MSPKVKEYLELEQYLHSDSHGPGFSMEGLMALLNDLWASMTEEEQWEVQNLPDPMDS